MKSDPADPSPVTICVLTYGPFPQLARRCLESVRAHCKRDLYQLVVGANAVCAETERYLREWHENRAIDRLILSPVNLHKSRMMRRMFEELATEFVWWFDDDSYVTDPRALGERLGTARAAAPQVVLWGQQCFCTRTSAFWEDGDALAFVRTASWYRGLPPPFWEPGGKGEFDFAGLGTGDGHWDFVPGGCWFVRTRALRALDWPDPRLVILGDDVFLGEAVRQQGWEIGNIGDAGVETSRAERRWKVGDVPPVM